MQTLPPTPHSSSRDRPSTKRSSPACEQQPKRWVAWVGSTRAGSHPQPLWPQDVRLLRAPLHFASCSSKIFLWRAGSVESECTRLDMSTSPAAAAPEAAGDGGGGKEGGWDSAESQSVLQAPNVLGSGASDAEISGLAAPPQPQATLGAAAHVAGEGAAAAPGSQPDEELVQAPRQLVSPEFLAELAAANACLQHLPLPGEPQPRGTACSLVRHAAQACKAHTTASERLSSLLSILEVACGTPRLGLQTHAGPPPARHACAGGVHFSPVHPSCVLLPLFESYEMPPAAVALGASYFQRLLAGCEGLAEEAVAAGFFSWHPAPSGKLVSSPGAC